MGTSVVQCCLCSAQTWTITDMENHILTDHSDIFRTVSDSPDGTRTEESPPQRIEIKEEIKTESDQYKTSKEFKSEIGQKYGLVILDGKLCSKCSFIATDLSLLNNHVIEKHWKSVEGEEKLQDSTFSLKHRFEQTCQEKRNKCLGCYKSFRSQSHLKRHQETVHIRKAVPCTECAESFPSLYYHDRHYEEVHGEKRFRCPKCKKSFGSNSHVKRHLKKVHSANGVETGNCPTCIKLFLKSNNLKRHVKMMHHPKSTALPCQLCDKSFFDLYSCHRHCKEAHGRKKFICPTCESCFRSTHLKRHQEIVLSLKSTALLG